MAKEITVTFEDGGVFEGFANTYTLNNEVTYYFSFDRDYRVQLTSDAITLQEYRNAGAWYPIDIITGFAVTEISGTGGNASKEWVEDNFQPKGDYLTKWEAGQTYVTKNYADRTYITQLALNETLKQYLKITDYIERMKLYVKRSGDTMTGPLKFPKVWNETISAVGDLLPEVTLSTNGDFNTILSNETNGFAIYLDEDVTNKNYFTINLKGIKNDYLIAGLFDSDITTACIFKLGTSLDTSAATFNILCAGGGSGRQETLIESTNPVYLNNGFGIDGELKIKEFAERASETGLESITIHPKNVTINNDYPLFYYNRQESTTTYYSINTDNSNGQEGCALTRDGLWGYSVVVSALNRLNLQSTNGDLLIRAHDGYYFDTFLNSSIYAYCTYQDLAWLHLNRNNLVPISNNSTSLKKLADNSEAIEATYSETFYGNSMLDALNDVINNMQETLGTYFFKEFQPDTFTGGGKSRGGGVGRHQTTE